MAIYIIEVDLSEEEVRKALEEKLRDENKWGDEIKIIVMKEQS